MAATARGFVSRDVTQASNEILDVLEERRPSSLGFVAGSTTVGVVGAQEVADRVLPIFNMPREPETASQFAASGVVKGLVATGIGLLAPRFSGLVLAVMAFAGIGALASAGADFVNAIQRTGFLAESPFRGQQIQQDQSGSSSSSPSPSRSSGGQAAELSV